MRAKIRNFRGISEADLDISGVTLIAGLNHSGKTSIVQALGAALTGSPIPISGITKAQSGLFVHAGAAGGEVAVDFGTGSARIEYPSGTCTTDGVPVTISDDASGVHSFIDDSTSDRHKTISAFLKSDPTKDQLGIELTKAGANQAGIDRVWDTVTKQGWDAAHKTACESGTRLKGGWEQESGERYGSKKAESWRPASWSEDLDSATEESLADVVKQETEWLEAAISHQAVGDAELTRLKILADGQPAAKQDFETLISSIAGLEGAMALLRKGLSELPRPSGEETTQCPHCKGALVIRGKALAIPKTYTPEETAAQQKAISDVNASIKETETELVKQKTALADARFKLSQSTDAIKKLAEPKPAEQTQSVETVRARLALAQARQVAFSKKTKAAKIHSDIERNKIVIDILAPDGLRMTCLKGALGRFNERLRALSGVASWRSVEIQSDMSVTFGGSLYSMLSESEQYRVQIVLQVAFSEFGDSPVLLIDRADVLDMQGRNSLFQLLVSTQKTCLVAMTVLKRETCPDLAKIGGHTYWIENGAVAQ